MEVDITRFRVYNFLHTWSFIGHFERVWRFWGTGDG